MIDNQTFEYIMSKLDGRKEEITEFVAQGSIKDFPEYQRLCGTIQGLVFARELINDLAKRLETNDDE